MFIALAAFIFLGSTYYIYPATACNRKTDELSKVERVMEKLGATTRLTAPCVEVDGELVPDIDAPREDLYSCSPVKIHDLAHLRDIYPDRCIRGRSYRKKY